VIAIDNIASPKPIPNASATLVRLFIPLPPIFDSLSPICESFATSMPMFLLSLRPQIVTSGDCGYKSNIPQSAYADNEYFFLSLHHLWIRDIPSSGI
ncbi:MAG: hypothetical protein SPL56_06870, partial [Lachnospiraceae bacterium]|nr:hypothetical protein [Lachnospiraceae bacterium]